MSTSKKPDEGCLSVLSSCFKGREKRQPVDVQTATSPRIVATANDGLPPTSRVPQQHAPTPQSTSDPISQPGATNRSSSAIIDGTSSLNLLESDHTFFSTHHSKAPPDLWQEAYNAAEEHTQPFPWVSGVGPQRRTETRSRSLAAWTSRPPSFSWGVIQSELPRTWLQSETLRLNSLLRPRQLFGMHWKSFLR